MIRRLFTIASCLSLLVLLASTGLWLRSFWSSDGVLLLGPDRAVLLTTGRGGVWWLCQPYASGRRDGWTLDDVRWGWALPPPLDDGGGVWGFASGRLFTRMAREPIWGRVPLWPVPAGSGLLPGLWLARWLLARRRARRRSRLGLCLTCGYDLTRNVSGVCPECGTPVPADLIRKAVT